MLIKFVDYYVATASIPFNLLNEVARRIYILKKMLTIEHRVLHHFNKNIFIYIVYTVFKNAKKLYIKTQ